MQLSPNDIETKSSLTRNRVLLDVGAVRSYQHGRIWLLVVLWVDLVHGWKSLVKSR